MQFSTLRTRQVMLLVVLAAAPALLLHGWFFGIGTLLNIVIATAIACAIEASLLWLRELPVMAGLSDCSILVTGLLFGIAIPPGSPWWLIVLGVLFAVALAKHAFGGLGQNLFNPAMAGYLFLLLAFPLEMTTWHLPAAAMDGDPATSPLALTALGQSLSFLFPASSQTSDGLAMATPLIEYKMASPNAIAAALDAGLPVFSRESGTGWELVNAAYLLGGVFLLTRGVISWHIPLSIIATVSLLAWLFYAPGNSAVMGTPYLHLFGSATLIGAFFIATDPVSAATSNPARLVYGVIIGCGIYSIRVWGSYLDSIAIAVLFGNFCAPLLDHYLRPRIFGHGRARSALQDRVRTR